MPVVRAIIITGPMKVSPDAADDTAPIFESEGEIPIKQSLPPFECLYDYGYINFSTEDIANLWIMSTLTQPGYPHQYAKLNDGYWYIIEDGKNMRMMVEHEYKQFVQWVTGTLHTNEPQVIEPVNNSKAEVCDNGRPQHLAPNWTPKPAD